MAAKLVDLVASAPIVLFADPFISLLAGLLYLEVRQTESESIEDVLTEVEWLAATAHNQYRRCAMKNVELPIPELGVIAVTRGLLGAGVGLLIAGRLSDRRRTVVGRILVAIGALSTIPLAIDVVRKGRKA